MNTNSIFITGAASGIGLAAARHFHEMGYVVAMADLNFALLEDVTEQWDKTRISLYPLDVSDFSQAQQVMSEFCNGNDNSLSVLLNNAGILEVGAFEDINNNQHQRVISVNVMGVINLCQAAWPYLKNNSKNSGKDNNKSTIVNMSSASSDYGVPELASYSASKFAVKALTEALELEWQKYGIRVYQSLSYEIFESIKSFSHRKNRKKGHAE